MIYRLICDHDAFHHLRGYFRIDTHEDDIWYIHLERMSDLSLLDSLINRKVESSGDWYNGLLIRGDTIEISSSKAEDIQI